jgi:hypothetical protein
MIENAASADIVVVGTVTRWTPTGSAGVSIFKPIELTLSVERILKGSASETIRFVESTSYAPAEGATHQWAGGSGACGTFDADPTGVRALYALRHTPEGTLAAGRCSGTYLGIGGDPNAVGGVDGESYIAQVEAALAAAGLPNTGTGPTRRNESPIPLGSLALVTMSVALGGLALCVGRRDPR